MTDKYFLIFFLTIIVIRTAVWLKPIPGPTIKGFRTHHYMYGLLGIILSLVIHSPLLYSIGLGLFVDELTYLLIGGKTHEDNYSKTSLIGTFLFVVLVYFLRYKIFFF